MNKLALYFTVVLTITAAPALAFEISFDWAGLKPCNNGNPNTVVNPRFTVKNVPAGTNFIRFKLTDRDAPSYNHGGGVVAWSGKNTIEQGAFKYKSPCPPGGQHTYEWTATAQSSNSSGKLGTAKAKRKYPE